MAANTDASAEAVSMVTEVQGKIVKVSADITGDLSREMLKLLFLIISNNNKTHSQRQILEMMRSGEGAKCLEIKLDGLARFDSLAKQEGLEYNAVENIERGTVMISFRLSDIDKANRIMEKMPATVKLIPDAEIKNITITEEDRDQALKEGLGIYTGSATDARGDVTITEDRSQETPPAFTEALKADILGRDGHESFTPPASSDTKDAQPSEAIPRGSYREPEKPRAETEMPATRMFPDSRPSVIKGYDEWRAENDLAGNDLVPETQKDITAETGIDR